MSLRRLFVLLGKEFIHGSKSFLFIWILVAPILITLLFSLVFGTLFRENPRLGILDLGTSQLVEMAKTTDSLSLKVYNNPVDMKKAVEKGVIDFGLMGVFLPATSLIEEKNRGTVQAIIVTPITMAEIITSKGLLGVIISMVMGIIILFLNNAFGYQPLLLLILLLLGAIMAATISLMLGILVKDFTTLFSVWKSGGILLFFPDLVYIFPKIPQWLSKIFPTYYLITPIVEIVQKGAGWQEAWLNMTVLTGVDVLLIIILMVIIKIKKPFTA